MQHMKVKETSFFLISWSTTLREGNFVVKNVKFMYFLKIFLLRGMVQKN